MDLLELLKATHAVIGQEISDLGLEVLAGDLEDYPLEDLKKALSRCRKELRKLTLADILDRLPGRHPGAEEAWAIVSASMQSESVTIVWTDEMRFAFGIANALADDPVAARMAFKEHYLRLVSEARALGEKPSWSVSLGTDQSAREYAILEGVKAGRLLPDYAKRLLPHPEEPQTIALLQTFCPRLLS